MVRQNICANDFLNKNVLQSGMKAYLRQQQRQERANARLMSEEEPGPSRPKPRPWTEQEYIFYMSEFARLAMPKKQIELPPIKRKKYPWAVIKPIIERLIKPIPRTIIEEDENPMSKTKGSTVDMARIIDLAKPKPDENENIHYRAWNIKHSALKYEINDYILELSKPKPRPIGRISMEYITLDEAVKVSAKAMKDKASKRVRELAQPKRSFHVLMSTINLKKKKGKSKKRKLSRNAKLALIRKMNLKLSHKINVDDYCDPEFDDDKSNISYND